MWLQILGLSEDVPVLRVFLHPEVVGGVCTAWDVGYLWQMVMLVGLLCLCQELLDVPQIPVVYLNGDKCLTKLCPLEI